MSAPDLVVLDLMLPGMGGHQVARRISAARELPILMLTARGDEDDVLRGFEAGADDYLVKPFSPRVLVARARAILRRVGLEGNEREGAVEQGGLRLDARTREVTVDAAPVDLTTLEFDLPHALVDHPGWVYSREQLRTVRGVGYTFLHATE